jgi:hypothetical protein
MGGPNGRREVMCPFCSFLLAVGSELLDEAPQIVGVLLVLNPRMADHTFLEHCFSRSHISSKATPAETASATIASETLFIILLDPFLSILRLAPKLRRGYTPPGRSRHARDQRQK